MSFVFPGLIKSPKIRKNLNFLLIFHFRTFTSDPKSIPGSVKEVTGMGLYSTEQPSTSAEVKCCHFYQKKTYFLNGEPHRKGGEMEEHYCAKCLNSIYMEEMWHKVSSNFQEPKDQQQRKNKDIRN